MGTYDSCEKTGKSFVPETQYSFLYLMGWPTKDQMDEVNAGSKTFSEVRDNNLAEMTTQELFDGAQNLIESPDVQAYGTYETQNYGKVLYFAKQILAPRHNSRIRLQSNIR